MILLLHLDVPPFMVCAPGLGLKGAFHLDKGKSQKSDEDDSSNSGRDKANNQGSAGGRNPSNSHDDDCGHNEGDDPDSDDSSDKDSQDNESCKKTFDFYFQKNRQRTKDARVMIKKHLREIKEIEAKNSDVIPGILKARESKLKDLRADLKKECVQYTTQTKYYQAGNFNTMPVSWWAKSGKKEKWHHADGYYYHPDKHRQFVQAVQAVQMLDDENEAFFETYETECAKWYASWSLYGAASERGTFNTWRQDSYKNVPNTYNQEDSTMVLTRLTFDLFPPLDDDASAQKPHSEKHKKKNKRAGGSSAASASQQQLRVPKDAASAEDADAASQALNGQPRVQPSGAQKRKKKKAKLAAAALARDSLDAVAEDGDAGGGSEDEGEKAKDAEAEQADKDAQVGQAKKLAQDEQDKNFKALRAGLRVGRGVGGSSSQQVGVPGQLVVTAGDAAEQLDETHVRMAAGSKVIDLTADSDAEGDEGASSASAASKKGQPRKKMALKSEQDE